MSILGGRYFPLCLKLDIYRIIHNQDITKIQSGILSFFRRDGVANPAKFPHICPQVVPKGDIESIFIQFAPDA